MNGQKLIKNTKYDYCEFRYFFDHKFDLSKNIELKEKSYLKLKYAQSGRFPELTHRFYSEISCKIIQKEKRNLQNVRALFLYGLTLIPITITALLACSLIICVFAAGCIASYSTYYKDQFKTAVWTMLAAFILSFPFAFIAWKMKDNVKNLYSFSVTTDMQKTANIYVKHPKYFKSHTYSNDKLISKLGKIEDNLSSPKFDPFYRINLEKIFDYLCSSFNEYVLLSNSEESQTEDKMELEYKEFITSILYLCASDNEFAKKLVCDLLKNFTFSFTPKSIIRDTTEQNRDSEEKRILNYQNDMFKILTSEQKYIDEAANKISKFSNDFITKHPKKLTPTDSIYKPLTSQCHRLRYY